jgi:hypothetical protein
MRCLAVHILSFSLSSWSAFLLFLVCFVFFFRTTGRSYSSSFSSPVTFVGVRSLSKNSPPPSNLSFFLCRGVLYTLQRRHRCAWSIVFLGVRFLHIYMHEALMRAVQANSEPQRQINKQNKATDELIVAASLAGSVR